MLGKSRTAVKFFVYGLVLGILFAPRSGEESRARLISWVTDTISGAAKDLTGNSGS